MKRLSLRLLGGFLLRVDDRPRPLPARKAQALLAYLAVRAGRAHARATLTGLLWADSGERQARQSLRQTMVRLRRTLAESRRALVAQGDTVTLTPTALDLDVLAFEQLVRRGTPEALEAAVALYQGPLLDGVQVAAPSFEEWLESERARLAELALEALRRLVDRHVKAGRADAAILTAARLLALDPLQEEIHRTLMRLHARQGRRAAALRQYQTCVGVLQKELGVEPDASTRRLYLEILQRAAAPAPGGRRPAPSAPGPDSPLAADAPLVGRDAELARLRQRLSAAWRGEGQVVLVAGEAGVGKSRLIAELASAATARGTRMLVGHAYETEQILPFRPWVDALRAGHALGAMRELSASSLRRAELARLFPVLAGGEAPPPITREGHLRLFESLDAVLGALARDQPLLVVLEDLHWADEMSLRLLAFVARRLAERPVLLVASLRDEDLAETPALAGLLAELTVLPHVGHVVLGALSASATATLVRALARAGSNATRIADAVSRVWSLSEGNPFVIVETMRALRDGRLPDAGLELPRRVRELIAARLGRLGPRAQELARVASAFTQEIEFPVLQRAAGLSRRETAEAVEELVRRRVLDAVGERFDFTHVRLRQAVYQALLTPRRQALHAAIGEAVEAVYAGRLEDVYDRLVHHFSHADDPGRAVTHLVHLADKVARSHALEEAVRLLHDGLRSIERLAPAAQSGPRLDIVFRLAHILAAMLGRTTEARDLLLRHESLVGRLGQPGLSGTYHFWLAYTYGNLGDYPTAIAHAQRALEDAARAGDSVTMGRASYELCRESYMIGRPREGIAQGRQAVALLERSDERWWLGEALRLLALNLLHIGDFVAALEIADRVRAVGEATGEVRLQADAAWTVGRVYTVQGEGEAAIAACRRSVDLAADPVAQANAVGWLGVAHLEHGDAEPAVGHIEDAIARLHRLSGAGGGYRNRQLDGMFGALLGEAHLMAGDVERARASAEEALAITRAGGWGVAVGYAERAVGRVALATGRLEDAEAALERALLTFAAIEARAQVARTRMVLAELRAARGDRRAAAVELHAAFEFAEQMRAPRLVESTLRLAVALGVSREVASLADSTAQTIAITTRVPTVPGSPAGAPPASASAVPPDASSG